MLAFRGVNACDGVLERRLLGVVDGLFDDFVVAAYALHERLLIVLEANAVERHGVMGRVVFFKKNVVVFCFLYAVFIHTRTIFLMRDAKVRKISDTPYYYRDI